MSDISRLRFSLAHLQVRSANLDDVVEQLGLLFERGMQFLQGREQIIGELGDGRYMHGRRESSQ
jgi:hypothetical protein